MPFQLLARHAEVAEPRRNQIPGMIAD